MQAMQTPFRWLAPCAPALLAASLWAGAFPVQARDPARVLVDISDVAFRSGTPYYRYGHYRQSDRLVLQRDRYGRPAYYRYAPRGSGHMPAYGRGEARHGNVRCDRHGKCRVNDGGRRGGQH